MPDTILIIDDDENTLWLIGTLLQHHGFNVLKSRVPLEGLQMAQDQAPDLVLLDVMMPKIDGWEVCRRLRETSDVPVIFITAKDTIKDVVKGLEIGGNDYLIKPFDNQELVARVRAHLRQRQKEPRLSDELSFGDGDLQVNFRSREVSAHGQKVDLTPKEFALLSLLAQNVGRVITSGELINSIWGPEHGDAKESLKLYVHYLRHKIERNPEKPEYILTSRGVGYRFVAK